MNLKDGNSRLQWGPILTIVIAAVLIGALGLAWRGIRSDLQAANLALWESHIKGQREYIDAKVTDGLATMERRYFDVGNGKALQAEVHANRDRLGRIETTLDRIDRKVDAIYRQRSRSTE